MEIKEKDFEKHLAILGNREVYCIFGGRPELSKDKQAYVISRNSSQKTTEWIEKQALDKYLKRYIKRGWTVWVSLNAKDVANDTIEGVKKIYAFWFDFDAEREDKSQVATNEQRAKALEETKRFKAFLEERGMRGFIACSGNGYHIFFPVAGYELRGRVVRKEFNQKQRDFYSTLRHNSQCTFDTTTDIRRVTQAIGYPNMKIPDNPVQTYWEEEFGLEDIKEAREKNEQIIDAVLNTEIEKTPIQIPSQVQVHTSFADLLKKNEKLRGLYEGNIELTYDKNIEQCQEIRGETGKLVYPSRNEAEQALVTMLCREGYNDREIKDNMRGCGIGKWQEKAEGYRDITLRKARTFVDAESIEEEKEKERRRTRKKGRTELKDELMGIVVNDLMSRYTFITPDDTEEVYVYDAGIYKPCKALIKSETEGMLGVDTTYASPFIDEVIGHIQRTTYVARKLFNENKELLPVKNGLLNLRTDELQDFDQSQIFTYQLPVNYDPQAVCPNIQEFVHRVVPHRDIELIQEFLGYCLYPDMPAHKSLWLYGTGRNGKTTLVNLIRALLGDICTVSVSLDELGATYRFSKARLYGKLLNVVSEPVLKAMETVNFKKLLGSDLISAEVKNKQDTIDFINVAKFIIAGNRFPFVLDSSLAFWDRIIVVEFPNIFTNTAIPNYERVLIEKDGLSGFLNWCLEGLKRLRSNDFHFSLSKGSEEMKQQFMRQSNSARAFIEERCKHDSTGSVVKDELYELYKDFCTEEGLIVHGKKALTEILSEQPGVYQKKKRLGNTIKMCWFGIKILPTLEAQIYKIVNSIYKEDKKGALLEVVIERVEGYTEGEVVDRIDELEEDGNLFVDRKDDGDAYLVRG